MKTFFKYLLFIFVLMLGQLQSSWAAGNVWQQDPSCPPNTKGISTSDTQCVKNPRDGYTCPNPPDDDGEICYQNCRDGYSSSGVATCHYTAGGTTYTKSCHTEKISCSYYKNTKIVKKCSGGGTTCDGCRDGYADDGLICRYKGTWDYARDSYTRATRYESKNSCATPGYTYSSSSNKCECRPTLTATTTATTSNAYYPKTSVILTATASGVNPCGASSLTTFTASFKNASNTEVAKCTSTNGTSCSVVWNADVGSYNIASTISSNYTNNAVSASVPVTVINIPATVSMTAPANNSSYLTTNSIPLTVSSNISNGIIRFYKNNENSIWVSCTIAAPPATSCTYTVPSNWLSAGSYTVQAKDSSMTAVSTPVAFTVSPPFVSNVSITSPGSNASYASTDTISLTASSNTAGVTIDFYKNNESSVWGSCSIVSADTSCSVNVSASTAAGGSNTVVAKIRGTNTTSSTVSFTVGATIAITSPVNNTSYARSSTIPLTATGNVSGTTIEFYKNNSSSIWVTCTIGAAPANSCTYNFASNAISAGTYSVTAKVRNTNTISSPISFTVTP